MLFFAAASLTRHHERQKETQRGETELKITEFSIFDCYLGATVSNYCLEPLKKLITGSDRRPAGRPEGQTDRGTDGGTCFQVPLRRLFWPPHWAAQPE